MSIGYTFINSRKREEAEKLAQVLTGIQNYCQTELDKAKSEVPLMNDIIEDIEYHFRKALQRCSPWYREDENDIGVSLSGGFNWAAHNGFQCLDDVRKFMDDHPGYQIEDDYGNVVSLDSFIALVSGNTRAIRFPKEVSGV